MGVFPPVLLSSSSISLSLPRFFDPAYLSRYSMLHLWGLPSAPRWTNATASYTSVGLRFESAFLPFSFVGVPTIRNDW